MEDNIKGEILSLEPRLCPSILPLWVDGILFSVPYVLAKHPTLTIPLHYSCGTDLPVSILAMLFPPGALY